MKKGDPCLGWQHAVSVGLAILAAGGCGRQIEKARTAARAAERGGDAAAVVEPLGIADVALKAGVTEQLNAAIEALANMKPPDPDALDRLFRAAIDLEGAPQGTDMIAMLLATGERERLERGVSEADRIAALDRILSSLREADPDKLTPQMRQAMSAHFDMTRRAFAVKQDAASLAREAKAIFDHQRTWNLAPEQAVRAAADLYIRARPETTPYEARRLMMAALRQALPGEQTEKMRLHGEPGLAAPDGAPACPPADPRWTVKSRAEYWDDPTWQSLFRMPAEQLPDGALLEACRLLSISLAPVGLIEREGYREVPTEFARTLVVRYGERALPGLYAMLADPERAAAEAGGAALVLKEQAKRVARELPAGPSCALYTSALLAGWVDWEYQMPETPEHKAVLEAFKDSPYGHWWQR